MDFAKGDVVNITLQSGEALNEKVLLQSKAYAIPEKTKYLTGEIIPAVPAKIAYLATEVEYRNGLSKDGVMSIMLDEIKSIVNTGRKGPTKIVID